MSTIFQRLEKKQDKILDRVKEQAKEEMKHEWIAERYRGKSIWEKLEGVIKIITA